MRAFPGTNPTKIKAMVETGNVKWDIAQLSRGSIMNLQKHGNYFEKIDYSQVDDGGPAGAVGGGAPGASNPAGNGAAATGHHGLNSLGGG